MVESPNRKRSKGEIRVAQILQSVPGLLVREEMWWPQCKDKAPLRFDFFIMISMGRTLAPKCAVVEVDGRQHFEILRGCKFGNTPGDFAVTQAHDVIKNRFLLDHGISLLRISYREIVNCEILLKQFLRDAQNATKPIHVFSNPQLYKNPFGDPATPTRCTIS